MVPIRLSASVRKFVRREKARMRREVPDPAEAEKKIQEIILATRKKNLP